MLTIAGEDVDFKIYEGIGQLLHLNPVIDNDEPPATVIGCRESLKAQPK
jgi:hypothetical protein